MDQDRWSNINRIFHAALEVDPSRRGALVASESNGDPALQAEVERLLQADADAGSYLESPLLSAEALAQSASPLAPGDTLCGRFRILREIAEGGMGHVFEAFDSELAVRVALKVIRPEIASNPEAVSRFRQEVRLARSITHPNICRAFDIERETRAFHGRPAELVFLTMEFLPGETLAARIARTGPLPLDEALRFASHIAAALQAAHALGIIHRDMKPANIMLVASGPPAQELPRAVVTDFGLARLDPLLASGGLSSFTNAGHPIGTLAYMAPEQLEGAPVSPATDIYAFGLILFEMAAGKRAFPSSNLLSGIAQRLRGPLPLDRLLPPQTPANWRNAIASCLEIAPAARPQTAAAVIAMLEDDRRRFFPGRRHASIASRRLLPRIASIAALLALAVALSIAGLRLYQSKEDSRVVPGALVYLAPVKNNTGDKSFDTLTELIQAGLSQSMQVNLLDRGRVGDILQQMTKSPDTAIDAPTAREIAMRAGAVRVIFATVTGARGAYSLNVDIQQPDNTPTRFRDHWTRSFTWQMPAATANASTIPAGLLTQVRSASDWVRHEAGESANDIARLNTPPEDVTTDSWDALAEYMRAVRLSRNHQSADAVVALHNATQIDPRFALAYGALADIQLTLHHEAEGFAAYKRALDPSLERRLSRRERDRIEGMYAVDSWDFPAAVDAFRDYQTFYPNDALGWMYPTYPLMMLGRDNEAVANLEHALALDPGSSYARNSLVDVYVVTGDLNQAQHILSQSLQLGNDPGTTVRAGILAFLEGRYDQAEKQFSSLNASSDLRLRSRSYEMLADLAAERGRFAQAIQILEQGMKEDLAQGNPSAQSAKLADRGWMKARLGDFAGCSADLRSALSLNPSPQLILMAETVLGQAIQLAPSAASRPLRQQMVELDRNLPEGDYGMLTRILTMRTHAETQLALGEIAPALKAFRDLAAVDNPAGPREYLGRALVAAAAVQPDEKQARILRAEAEQAYAVVALHPGVVWYSPYIYPPGFLADQRHSCTQLSATSANPRTLPANVQAKPANVPFHQAEEHECNNVHWASNYRFPRRDT